MILYHINKTSPDSSQMVYHLYWLSNGNSLHSVARDLAARETIRQWDDLEKAIKLAQPENAAKIIQAIKINTNQP